MHYRIIFFGSLITFGALSNQAVVASQAPMRSQAEPSQAGVLHHQGTSRHSGANQEEQPGKHPGVHAHPEVAHSGKKASEKEITPVKQKLIEVLKNQKESPIHCTADGKNHPLTAVVIEEKETKVKKKGADFIVTLSSGSQVTCSK